MNTSLALIILGEILLTLFIVWGLQHEQLFIRFEDRIIAAAKLKIRRAIIKREKERRRRLNARVVYSPMKPEKRTAKSSRRAA